MTAAVESHKKDHSSMGNEAKYIIRRTDIFRIVTAVESHKKDQSSLGKKAKCIIRRTDMFRKVSSRLLRHMKRIMVCKNTVLSQIEADQ